MVGIRPEHLTVAEGVDADRETTLAAHVELVEALGNESLVHFSTDARRVRNRGGAWTADAAAVQASGDIAGASAAEGVARVDPRVRVSAGERIALAVDVGRLHFFDAETGDAIGATGGGSDERQERADAVTPAPATTGTAAAFRPEGDGSRPRLSARRRQQLAGWLFLTPAIAYLLFAFALPIVYNVMLSFERTSPATIANFTAPFAGLDNYRVISQ